MKLFNSSPEEELKKKKPIKRQSLIIKSKPEVSWKGGGEENAATWRRLCMLPLPAGTFTVICCLVIILLALTHKLEAVATKPPRGYCTQISRAVGPNSRCYEHLIGGSRRRRSLELVGSENGSGNDLANGRDKESATGEKISQGEAPQKEQEEELVYVRLETVGSTIRDLSVQAINERLLVGVSRRLLGEAADGSSIGLAGGSGNGKLTEGGGGSMTASVRAQILGGGALADGVQGSKLADKCRLSIEKFLCRMVYPVCHFRRADVSALVRPPCREDCLLLRDVLCSNLDWSQFITVLGEAFNETLLSTINSLDLKAQGDLQEDGSRGGGGGASLDSNLTHSNKQESIPSHSVHLYWPHQQSIHKCESLPPLRPMIMTSASNSKITNHHHSNNTNHRAGHNNFARRRSNRKRWSRAAFMHNLAGEQFKWPVCSNAHLTLATPPTSGHQQGAKRQEQGDKHKENGQVNYVKGCLESEDGIEYAGEWNRTGSGRLCQQWQSQLPHSHKSSELLFDNMKEAHNFCRNPGGVELKPWCYTLDSNVRWEFCDIPRC